MSRAGKAPASVPPGCTHATAPMGNHDRLTGDQLISDPGAAKLDGSRRRQGAAPLLTGTARHPNAPDHARRTEFGDQGTAGG